jgi:uncharacterized membrane protein YbaN (DUF454 family)
MNKRFLLIIEIIWIVTGTLCLAAGIINVVSVGNSRTFIFLLLAVISFIFAWLRHRQRKNG